MCFNDYEFVILLIGALFLYFTGLKKKDKYIESRFPGIDLPMTTALKGIACILILMGHYVTHRELAVNTTHFSRLIQYTTANIALAFFMFFSGYGLSLKNRNGGSIFLMWVKRLKKVYIPLLFTCIVTFIIYLALPETYSISESETLHIPQDIHYLHKFEKGSLSVLVPHLLGWKDWYVFCIIIFYSLFYLSSYLTRNKENNQTWVLWLLFIAYFAFAYMSFGPPEAHWYRYCWAFFGGHIYAKMVKSQQYNRLDIAMFALLYSTTFIEGLFMEISYILAIIIIFISAKLCSSYNMLSPVLAFLGGVSYFFYLSHVRIVFAVFTTYGLFSVLIWVLFAILVSWLLKKGYDKLPFIR